MTAPAVTPAARLRPPKGIELVGPFPQDAERVLTP